MTLNSKDRTEKLKAKNQRYRILEKQTLKGENFVFYKKPNKIARKCRPVLNTLVMYKIQFCNSLKVSFTFSFENKYFV